MRDSFHRLPSLAERRSPKIWGHHLAEGVAAEIFRHWGFRPVSLLTWDKERAGTGICLRGQTEYAVLAVRGKAIPPSEPGSTLLSAPRPHGHSTKPDEFYSLVERLFPGSRVEIFARKERPGWACSGREVWEGRPL
jgi:N6-adenosine-specific RNA methylase IME4